MTEAVFLDIDGVLTDGRIYMDGNGAALKTLNLKDLDAITSMRGEGIRVGCVSGEDTPFSQAIRHYVDFAALGCEDKPGSAKYPVCRGREIRHRRIENGGYIGMPRGCDPGRAGGLQMGVRDKGGMRVRGVSL